MYQKWIEAIQLQEIKAKSSIDLWAGGQGALSDKGKM